MPIEERPVPQSETPGERTSPTQPFPTKPPAFDRQGATVDNLIDFTPELREEALQLVSRYTMGPMFTPPTIVSDDPNGNQGTVQLPGSQGGADVQGAGFDPETGHLYIPSITAPFVADILEGNPDRTNLRYVKGRRRWIAGPRGLPLFKPPYGRITAIDMNRGDIIWQIPNGDGPRNHPAIQHLNLGSARVSGETLTARDEDLAVRGRERGLHTRRRSRAGGHADRVFAQLRWGRGSEPMTSQQARSCGKPSSRPGRRETRSAICAEGKQYIVVAVGSPEGRASVRRPCSAVKLPLQAQDEPALFPFGLVVSPIVPDHPSPCQPSPEWPQPPEARSRLWRPAGSARSGCRRKSFAKKNQLAAVGRLLRGTDDFSTPFATR